MYNFPLAVQYILLLLCSEFVPPSEPQVDHISAGEDDHYDKEVGEVSLNVCQKRSLSEEGKVDNFRSLFGRR